VLDVLSTVQDFVAETIAEPWPARAHELPMPDVKVTSGAIELRFADALELSPVDRRELERYID
jgi:hypothetical protein